jgi:WD40 repeat protein
VKRFMGVLLAGVVIQAAACSGLGLSAPRVTTTRPVPMRSPVVPATPAMTSNVVVTATPAPATVARPGLASLGPYLAYVRSGQNGQDFVLMNPDGRGQSSLPLPMGANVELPGFLPLSNLISSDGKWLAFYTGSAGQAYGHVGADTADLALNLTSLPDGRQTMLAHLLSANYPANFAQEAQQLADRQVTATDLQNAFLVGITRSIAWSPDGRRLAFAGEMDGPSSDLYVYNTADWTIARLSNGPEEIQWIDWSPDNKWIVYASSLKAGEGAEYSLRATTIDGKLVRKLLENSTIEPYTFGPALMWVNHRMFLAFSVAKGPGTYGLETVDVESGTVVKVWEGLFDSVAVDPTGRWLALHLPNGELHLIDPATLRSMKVQLPDRTHAYGTSGRMLGIALAPDEIFLIRDQTDSSWWFLSSIGAMTTAGIKADLASVAPNEQDWIAVSDCLRLFTSRNSQTMTFSLPKGTKAGDFRGVLWRPDSSGIFLIRQPSSGTGRTAEIYTVDFPSGHSALVEPNLSTQGSSGPDWAAGWTTRGH